MSSLNEINKLPELTARVEALEAQVKDNEIHLYQLLELLSKQFGGGFKAHAEAVFAGKEKA